MASFSINAILGNAKQINEETNGVALGLGQKNLEESRRQQEDLTGLYSFTRKLFPNQVPIHYDGCFSWN